MFRKLKNWISVVFTLMKFMLIKLIRYNEFSFQLIERFSPNTMINIYKNSRLVLGNRIRMHTGCKLSVTSGAQMIIGDNTAFNYNCILVAREKIIVGSDCTFGPGVIVYDHDHDFRNSEIMNGKDYKAVPIVIGNNVWIGANAILLKGTVIGDNTVVAAGTVINGKIVPSNSVAYNNKELCVKKY